MRVRGEELRELMRRALVSRGRTAEGVRLRFRRSPRVDAEVRDLARREKECCPFFEFSFAELGDELELLVSAPDEAGELLDALFTPIR